MIGFESRSLDAFSLLGLLFVVSATLVAVGAYQLGEALRASQRLAERDVPHTVVYVLEPGRFRVPRSRAEEERLAPTEVRAALFPENIRSRLLLTHTCPEPLLGLLVRAVSENRVNGGPGIYQPGGTYDTPGLLFVHRCG